MSYFDLHSANSCLDDMCAEILVRAVVSNTNLQDNIFSLRRRERFKSFCSNVTKFCIPEKLSFNLGPNFFTSTNHFDHLAFEIGDSHSRNSNRNESKEKETVSDKISTVSTTSFCSGTSILRQRKDQGDPVAAEALEKIERETKRRKRDSKNGQQDSVTSNDTSYLQALGEQLGGEVNAEILQLVLSMRMSPECRIQESDISGLFCVKKLIRDKIIYPIKRPDLHLGLHQPPKGILLFGPPGTGKTMLARWIATESGATFFEVTPSALISKYYGETETIIRTLFLVAEYFSPSIIFIDEIDSLLGKRRERDDDSGIRMKNQLLQMMDGVRNKNNVMVVVLGATNRPDMLDDAALRRLTKRVLIPLPDLEARENQIKGLLVKHYFNNQQTNNAFNSPCSSGSDIGLSASELRSIAEKLDRWNGSDLKALCAKAADYSYDEAIAKYGGVEHIPDTSAFRQLQYNDFVLALNEVRPSNCIGSVNEDHFQEWEATFGCC